MSEHDRNKRPVFSEWIPREAVTGGGLDWSKVQVLPPGAAAPEARVDKELLRVKLTLVPGDNLPVDDVGLVVSRFLQPVWFAAVNRCRARSGSACGADTASPPEQGRHRAVE